MTTKRYLLVTILTLSVCTAAASPDEPPSFTNSLGIKMIRVEPGTFLMGTGRPFTI